MIIMHYKKLLKKKNFDIIELLLDNGAVDIIGARALLNKERGL